jgi:DNA-binding beta-propeller fold protein YncE
LEVDAMGSKSTLPIVGRRSTDGAARFARALLVTSVACAASSSMACAQARPDPNAAPNPYRIDEGWAKLPAGREWGAAIGVDIDRDGESVWVFDRCATTDNCTGSSLAPIQKFDAAGRLVTSFGAGLFNYPHGLFIDRDNNVWVCDGRAREGRGHTVMKFSPSGKLLMTLGKPGLAGDGPDTFNGPSDVLVAPNGDIFVADGHGGDTNARIVKLDKDGAFIKAWGKKGSGPGEFDTPHGLAMDAAGRLFVADRSNSRIQIFAQDGQFLAEWRQFGRPSGVFIDKNDILYVADSTSTAETNPGFLQGIRIGSVKDGHVAAFIPWTESNSLEGVAADDAGNVYAGYTNTRNFRRFVRR